MFWINISLVVCVIGTMVFTKISPTVAFMVALTVALMVNYPNVEMQKARINAHAKAALMMASILFAAGAFTGIMGGAGMLKAMSEAAVGFVPPALASHIPFVVGLISMPLSLILITSASCQLLLTPAKCWASRPFRWHRLPYWVR
ncbi:SLC13 family permease [Candidatus Symbiopectobacterium sp. 'North America']|uniref:SLC13 family permease n=1 Tax=Candidatus Symbiopectobacterium sp. 'North America' TaxID=2794574 RepID=UPI001FD10B13|nr:SLC13 family permease [Candidatus Symbiopectobacterium sp. 'North America']